MNGKPQNLCLKKRDTISFINLNTTINKLKQLNMTRNLSKHAENYA